MKDERAALNNALAVVDAYREQYQAARARYNAAPAGQRATARTLLRHAGDQLRTAGLAADKAADELAAADYENRQQELAL